MKKRVLSILLCLCMVLMLCPVTAFAEGETLTPVTEINLYVDAPIIGEVVMDCRGSGSRPYDVTESDITWYRILKTEYTGGEEQPLDIIPAVKADGQVRQLLRREGGPPGVVAAAVDAILTVVDTAVGQQDLQQADAPAVGGKGVAAARDGSGGVADIALFGSAVSAAGGAGCVIFGGIGQDGQFFQDIHDPEITGQRPGGGPCGWDAQWRR